MSIKKVILIVFFAFFTIVFSYLVISETITKTDTVKLEGVVTDVHNWCLVDGVCSIEVDNKWWVTINAGLTPKNSKPQIRGKVIGIVFSEKNESVGKKVEVYAKKINENSLTIYGSKEYYVKVIGE